MLKRSVTLAALIGLVVFVPSVPARAARKRTRQCTIATRDATLEQDDGYPNVGTTAQAVGVVDETCDGQKMHGVQEFKTTINDISGVGGGGGGGEPGAGSPLHERGDHLFRAGHQQIYAHRCRDPANGEHLHHLWPIQDHGWDWAVPRGDR